MSADLAAHDRKELESFYRQHYAFVWRSLRRLGVRDSDLPDAVQDTFLIVFRKLGQFDHGCKATTWLYAICLRVASDRRRRACERRECLAESAVQGARTVDADHRWEDQADKRRLLQRVLDQLPEEQRTVFALFELEGWPGERIAEALGIPLPTVHSRLRLARGAFRRFLAAWQAKEQFAQRQPRVV